MSEQSHVAVSIEARPFGVQLTVEERDALVSMARSPGWGVFLKKYLLPEIRFTVATMEKVLASSSMRDTCAGVRQSQKALLNFVYGQTKITNPLTEDALAVLLTLPQLPESAPTSETPPSSSEEPKRVSRRSAHPVL